MRNLAAEADNPIRSGRVLLAAFFIAVLPMLTGEAMADCMSSCSSAYYSCVRGFSERGCETTRSICQTRCVIRGSGAYGAIAYSAVDRCAWLLLPTRFAIGRRAARAARMPVFRQGRRLPGRGLVSQQLRCARSGVGHCPRFGLCGQYRRGKCRGLAILPFAKWWASLCDQAGSLFAIADDPEICGRSCADHAISLSFDGICGSIRKPPRRDIKECMTLRLSRSTTLRR